MRKIDKYISKEKMCNLVVNRAEKLFELSSEEVGGCGHFLGLSK